MPSLIQCPSCDSKLKLKSLDVLKKGVKCPGCRNPLPTSWPPEEDDLLDVELIEEFEDDDESEEARSTTTGAADVDPDTFLRIDSSRVSLKEYWWGMKNPLVLLAWLIKVLRIRIPSSTNDPPVASLRPFGCSYTEFDETVRGDLEPMVHELKGLGFHSPLMHHIQHVLSSTTYHIVSVTAADGETVARLQRRHWRGAQPNPKRIQCSFITEFEDGSFLVTTNEKADMTWPGSIALERHQKAGIETLWATHQNRMTAESGGRAVRRINCQEDTADLLEDHHTALTEFHLNRGVFKSLTEADRRRIRDVAKVSGASTAGRHSEVLAQIEMQQEGRSSWVSGIVLLVISAAFFLGIGAANWSMKTVWILLGVLFVHELGHYLAMKMFGYRNLKMFFIPLFGAAVTGSHYNVPGWKKVIVSLAGPVPGIMLGAVIGLVGLFRGNDLAVEIAIMALILNGLNLIPVLPLDGGWVAHSLFFSRHYAVDVAFRVVAAVALLGASIAMGDRFLIGLGVFMLMGIPTVLRSGKIVHRMRGNRLAAVSADAHSIPPQTAVLILDEIHENFPTGSLNLKTQAQLTRNIFQSLNTVAPGVLGTIGLTAIHLGSLLSAVVVAGILVVGQHTNLGDLIDAVAVSPQTPYECGTARYESGVNADVAAEGDEICVVAEYADLQQASAAYTASVAVLPDSASMLLFGQTVLMSLPADAADLREEWLSKLEQRGGTVQVRSPEFGVPVSVACISESKQAAEQLEESLRLYFHSLWASKSLIPPWSPEFEVTAEQRKARRTLQMLHFADEDYEDYEDYKAADSEVTKLYEQMSQARRKGDPAQVEALRKQIDDINKEKEAERIASIRAKGGEEVSLEVIDIYVQQPQYKPPTDGADTQQDYAGFQIIHEEWKKRLGKLLGEIPLAEESPSQKHLRFTVTSGYSIRAGLIHTISGLSFHREVDGLRAMTQWLCGQGCVDLKYHVGNPFNEF